MTGATALDKPRDPQSTRQSMIGTMVLSLLSLWVIGQLAWMRHRLRQDPPVLLPALANRLVLAIGLMAVVVFEFSPLHLLWWFPLSYLLGAVILFFPLGAQFTMACLALLAWPRAEQKS